MQDRPALDLAEPDFAAAGARMHALASRLFPLPRSLTGEGVRASLHVLRDVVDLDLHEVPTGTPAFDWTMPQEWNVRAASITGPDGRVVADFSQSSLHVVGYSIPVRATLPLAELRQHLHTLPDQPDLIPYRTAYWCRTWGFCLPHRVAEALPDGDYDVVIDATLHDGALTYGEFLHHGESSDEFLLTTHICHPALANDNCSGMALLVELARLLSRRRTRLSYRFLFSPGTLGPLAWLSRSEADLGRIRHGLVVSGVGDGGGPTYKRSRRGDAYIDRAAAHVLAHGYPASQVIDFEPYGYDERQFCSPGFDLPVGLFQKSRFGTYPEYHTSADNLDFIRPEHLAQSLEAIWRIIDIAENDYVPLNLSPKGEPQLGRRGLYGGTGGSKEAAARAMACLWVLNQADGSKSLLDIAERARLPFATLLAAARALEGAGLLGRTAP